MNKLIDTYPSSGGDDAAGADPQELIRDGAAVFPATERGYVMDGLAGYLEFHAKDVAERARRMGQSHLGVPTAEELAAHDAKPSTIATREELARRELPDTGTSGLREQNYHGNG